MNNPREQDTKAPGHYGNQGPQQDGDRPSGQDRQEQYQRTKDQAPTDRDGQIGNASAKPDPDNNLGRGTPGDREDRIRQRAHEMWEADGRPKVRQIVTGAARLRTSTVKTPPSSAKAVLARNRASVQRGTLISSVIRASGHLAAIQDPVVRKQVFELAKAIARAGQPVAGSATRTTGSASTDVVVAPSNGSYHSSRGPRINPILNTTGRLCRTL